MKMQRLDLLLRRLKWQHPIEGFQKRFKQNDAVKAHDGEHHSPPNTQHITYTHENIPPYLNRRKAIWKLEER